MKSDNISTTQDTVSFLDSMSYGLEKHAGQTLHFRSDDLSRLFALADELEPREVRASTNISMDFSVDRVSELVRKSRENLKRDFL